MRFSELAQIWDQLNRAGNESRRVLMLAELFGKLDRNTLRPAAHFSLGEAVDPKLVDRLGIGPGMIREALATISKVASDAIDDAVRKTGDLGKVVSQLLMPKKDTLTVDGLWERINQTVSQDLNRRKLIEYVFAHTTPLGAEYFSRMVLNQMRMGVGTGTLIKALASAFDVKKSQIERSFVLSNDIGLAATQAQQGEKALVHSGLALFHPYQFMSAHKLDDEQAVFKKLAGKRILFEVKYDGARLQIHLKRGQTPEIRMYSRRLNDATSAMPDVVAALKKAWRGGDAILEGEAVAFDTALENKQPFQAVLMRLGRKHNVAEKAQELPLVLYLFDLLWLEGEDLMNLPLKERRKQLKALIRPTNRVQLTDEVETEKLSDERKFFKQAIQAGHEGLMAKDPDAPYLPGRRTEHWIKLKPAFETLDVVVTGGIWGSGRRRGLLSSLIVAVRDKDEFKLVGKVGAGLSEALLKTLTRKLEPKITASRGSHVEIEPEMVIEVDFQDIQKTNRYSAGYALRIPRFRSERTDKSIREADTLARLKRLYQQSH